MQNCSLTLLNCDGRFIRGGRIKLSLLLQVLLLYRFKLQNTGGNWKKDNFCHMVQIIYDSTSLSLLLLLGPSILLCVNFSCDTLLDFSLLGGQSDNTTPLVCWSQCHYKNLNPIHFITALAVLLALHCDLLVREVDGAILWPVQAISRLKLLSLCSKALSGLITVHLQEKTAHKLYHHIKVEHIGGVCQGFLDMLLCLCCNRWRQWRVL